MNLTQSTQDESYNDPLGPAVPVTENNLWGILDRWTGALPSDTPNRAARKQDLLIELRFLKERSGLKGKDGGVGVVFGHCDLLNGNVIILPEGMKEGEDELMEEMGIGAAAMSKKVHFIDYECVTIPPFMCPRVLGTLEQWGIADFWL